MTTADLLAAIENADLVTVRVTRYDLQAPLSYEDAVALVEAAEPGELSVEMYTQGGTRLSVACLVEA